MPPLFVDVARPLLMLAQTQIETADNRRGRTIVIKLTRLNNHVVAINPDHIGWADATPDTTLFLISGEKIIVRETLDELIAQVVEFRRRIRAAEPAAHPFGSLEGDPPRITVVPAARNTNPPGSLRSRGGQ